MSRIEDLLAELSPKGVQFKFLGEIGELVRGNGLPKSDFTVAGVGAIHYGQIYTYYGTWTKETISFVAPETAARLAKVDPGDVIITNTSENIEDVGKAVAWLGDSQIVTGGHATILKHDQDPRFVAYWFQSPSFHVQKQKLATGTKVIDVSANRLAAIRIPVPPLEMQKEIVRILNNFEKLEAELEAELEARKQQYVYYREKILSTHDSTASRWTTLGEICSKVSSGGTPSSGRADYYGGGIPWLRTQEVDFNEVEYTGVTLTEEGLRNSSANWIPANCVIVAMYGATAAKVAVNAVPLTTNQACCNLQVDPNQANHRYVFHWISSQYDRLRALGEGSQANLNAKKVKEFPILVPTLGRQQEIAATLDKFDALVNDLSFGLPAELAARRQQYEHYRDRLLTFKEAA